MTETSGPEQFSKMAAPVTAAPARGLGLLVPVAALLTSVAFLLAGFGLQQTLLPIRAGLEGFSSVEIGLLGSSYFSGYVIGCLFVPRLIIRVGHIRTFTALIALASIAALIHAIIITMPMWVACRLITGICLSGLYLIIESWLNERADDQTRGTIMASYITVNLAFMTVGQLLVTLFDPMLFVQFSVIAILMSMAALPVALTKAPPPAPVTLVRFRPHALFALSPAGIVGVFLTGVAHGAFWSLGPNFGQQIGLSVSQTALFMGLAVIGGACVQYPVGLLSDRMDRRLVSIGLASVATLLGVVLSGLIPLSGTALLLIAFFFGSTLLPIYTVLAAHVFDYTKSEGYVEVSASLNLLFGVGSILGPLAAAFLMEVLAPGALFAFMAAVNALIACYVSYRVTQRAPLTTEEKEDYKLSNVAPVPVVGDAEAFEESPLVVEPEPGESGPAAYDVEAALAIHAETEEEGLLDPSISQDFEKDASQ
ncbi:MAG: MFS transporter [Pseudomonadota bacterium]